MKIAWMVQAIFNQQKMEMFDDYDDWRKCDVCGGHPADCDGWCSVVRDERRLDSEPMTREEFNKVVQAMWAEVEAGTYMYEIGPVIGKGHPSGYSVCVVCHEKPRLGEQAKPGRYHNCCNSDECRKIYDRLCPICLERDRLDNPYQCGDPECFIIGNPP